jgi:hypothetical protein
VADDPAGRPPPEIRIKTLKSKAFSRKDAKAQRKPKKQKMIVFCPSVFYRHLCHRTAAMLITGYMEA